MKAFHGSLDSSGGIIIDEGYCLGVHDSQHDEHPAAEGVLVSTHRIIADIREQTKDVRLLQDLFMPCKC